MKWNFKNVHYLKRYSQDFIDFDFIYFLYNFGLIKNQGFTRDLKGSLFQNLIDARIYFKYAIVNLLFKNSSDRNFKIIQHYF